MFSSSARSSGLSFLPYRPRPQGGIVISVQARSMNQLEAPIACERTPTIISMRVAPVAGQDSMLLNLSGAHAPFFTRNLILLTDNAGHIGAGEAPGGEKIRRVLEDSGELIVGREIAVANEILDAIMRNFAELDVAGRGVETFDQRTAIHAV